MSVISIELLWSLSIWWCRSKLMHKQTQQTSWHTLTCMLINTQSLSFSYRQTQTVFSFLCLIFIYRAITQREWNYCTCLSISLFPNKIYILIKQQTHFHSQAGSRSLTSQPTHTRFIWIKSLSAWVLQRRIVGKTGIVSDKSDIEGKWEEEGMKERKKGAGV